MDKKVSVTLQLDVNLLRKIRALAEAEKKSVSSFLTTQLLELVRERKCYDRARDRAVARLQEGLDLRWTPRSRDELHER